MRRRLASFPGATSASSAVEFALVAPMFMLMMFGTMSYGSIMSTYSAVQQLVAEGARATVGGLSDTERDQLARSFIAANVATYPALDPRKVSITTSPLAGPPATFTVTVSYDMSSNFVYGLSGIVPLPASTVTRSAVVQVGGY